MTATVLSVLAVALGLTAALFANASAAKARAKGGTAGGDSGTFADPESSSDCGGDGGCD